MAGRAGRGRRGRAGTNRSRARTDHQGGLVRLRRVAHRPAAARRAPPGRRCRVMAYPVGRPRSPVRAGRAQRDTRAAGAHRVAQCLVVQAGRLGLQRSGPPGGRVPGFSRGTGVSAALPRDAEAPAEANLVATEATVHLDLDVETTGTLVRESAASQQLGIDELLLAALARVLAGWTGRPSVWLDLEGQGRTLPDHDDSWTSRGPSAGSPRCFRCGWTCRPTQTARPG